MIHKDYHKGLLPFSFVILIGWVLFGLLLMISTFFPNWEASPAIANMPDIIEFLSGIFILAGSIAILIAANSKISLHTSLKSDYVGLALASSGWLTYAIDAFFASYTFVGVWLFGLIMSIAGIVRLCWVREAEMKIRKHGSDV